MKKSSYVFKYFFIFLLLFFIIFFNEFSLIYFLDDKNISDFTIQKIRFANLVSIISLALITLYWDYFLNLKFVYKIITLTFVLVVVDVSSGFFNFGYKYNAFEENDFTYHFPYDEFRGKPNVLDHNKHGFRGLDIEEHVNGDFFKIAFFGGSTGYMGNPSIPELLNIKLNQDLKLKMFNFSSISSNHNQHLVRLLLFSEHKFDLIIFYGGYNETQNPFYYDPRPGYPLSFYSNQITLINKLLIKYSKIIGEVDINFGFFSGYKKLIKEVRNADLDSWINDIVKNYFNTLVKAKNVTTKLIKPNVCLKSHFVGIYQPAQSINLTTDRVRNKIRKIIRKNNDYLDFSDLKNKVVFTDILHINQESKSIIADNIYNNIYPILDSCKKSVYKKKL